MPKQIMHRTASDNEYLHQDFHGALSAGIEYLHENYGEDAVREYLWRFARTFYAPLTEAIKTRGLIVIEEHFRKIYDLEGGVVRYASSEHELRIEVEACPARTAGRIGKSEIGTVADALTVPVLTGSPVPALYGEARVDVVHDDPKS